MAITLRQTSTDPTGKSSALTHQEMNDNLKSYYQSSSLSGSTLELHTVSDTHSIDLSSLGGGSSVDISALNTFSGSAESRLDSIEAVTSSYLVPADTGSVYISSSVDQNRITFTQGDGSTQTLVIETGSADDSITYFTESISGTTATWTTSYETAEITSDCNRATLAAGSPATVDGNNSAIIGGTNNYVACNNSVVLAANVGVVYSPYSAVIGGVGNSVCTNSSYSSVLGGHSNTICDSAPYSAIIGGSATTISIANHSVNLGGRFNHNTSSCCSTIFGGCCNLLTNANHSSVVGGYDNRISNGNQNIVLGGAVNRMSSAFFSGILGGVTNCIANSDSSAVVGGTSNEITSSGNRNIILGGSGNCVNGDTTCATILNSVGSVINGTATYSTLINSRNITLTGDCSLVFSPSATAITENRDNIVRLDTSLLEVSGALSASGLVYPTADGTAGQVIVTDGSGVLSFASVSGSGGEAIDTGSFYVSSSINGTAITFLQGDGTTEVVNIPAGGIDTGSFYVSSSVDRNTITFTQGDGTVETVTIETGSADDVITEWVESSFGGKSTWTSTTDVGILTSTGNKIILGTTSGCVGGQRSAIIGGASGCVLGDCSVVIGGLGNCITSTSGDYSTIVGGSDSKICGASTHSSILGGLSNCVTNSLYASVIGGSNSRVTNNGHYSAIFASFQGNIDNSEAAAVVGGICGNVLNSPYSIVGGGCRNKVSAGSRSVILGGVLNNTSNATQAAILAGTNNCIDTSDCSAVIAGNSNDIRSTSDNNIILGGQANCINTPSEYSTLINSRNTTLTGICSLVFSPSTIPVTEARDNIVRLDTSLLEVSGALSASGLVYPTSDGTAGQVLTTDGSGVLSFASAGGASTLVGLTDTNISALPFTGSYLSWNGSKWVDDATHHVFAIQDADDFFIAAPNSNDVLYFRQGEGMSISYNTDTITFGVDLDWSSSYVDATQASSVWDAQGTGTDINAVLQAKGTGATTAQVPDGANAGGASRGDYATDFQKQRNNPNQVASGANSVIVGGSCNRAYGSHSTVLGGQENTAGGTFSTVLGGYQSCVGSSGTYSTALGNRAQVNAVGSFLFRDGSGTTPYVLTDNNTAAFVASKFYVEGTHEVSGSSFSSVGSPATLATSPTTVAVTVDADDHNFFELTLAASTTHTIAISNGQPGQTIVIKITQPSSGTPGLISWSGASNIKQAFDSDNNVTSLNSAEDIFTLVRFGTDWYLNAIKRFS